MRKHFVSLISNGRFQLGCTGQTVYVLDAAGNELAKFRDMTYAYYPALHPDGEVAAVYSNTGIMAVYSLSELRLITKFRVSYRGPKRRQPQQPLDHLFDNRLSAGCEFVRTGTKDHAPLYRNRSGRLCLFAGVFPQRKTQRVLCGQTDGASPAGGAAARHGHI